MKATAKRILFCLVTGIMCSGSVPADAGSWSFEIVSLVAGQSNPLDPSLRKKESEQLLKMARTAMLNSEFDQAELYISQAERLNVSYDPLHARFYDTPEKARRELEKLKAERPNTPVRPSQRFPALSGIQARNAADAGADPFDRVQGKVNRNSVDAIAPNAEANAAQALNQSPFALRPSDVEPQAVDRMPLQVTPPNSLLPVTGSPYPDTSAPGAFRVDANNAPTRLPPTESIATKREQALQLVARAQAALDRGDAVSAKQLAEQAQKLRVPDEYFENSTRPWQIVLEANRAASRGGEFPVMQAGGDGVQRAVATQAVGPNGDARFPISPSIYNPANDYTRNVQANALRNTLMPRGSDSAFGMQVYQQGLQALSAGKRELAMERFQEAWKYNAEMDADTRKELQTKIMLLNNEPGALPELGRQPTPLEEVTAEQHMLRQRMLREITSEQATVERMQQTDPRGALDRLTVLRNRVRTSELDPPSRKQLLTIVDRKITEMEQYIENHKATIELNEQNRETLAKIDRARQSRVEVRQAIAELVEQFNQLIDEQRYAEAEVIAKQARELDPSDPTVVLLIEKSRFARRIAEQHGIKEATEEGVYNVFTDVARSAISSLAPGQTMAFPDKPTWDVLKNRRARFMEGQNTRLTKAELEIREALKDEVQVNFNSEPLATVISTLGKMTGINVHLDPQGMHAEGITSDTPVDLNLPNPIPLRSALNLILEPLHLSYVIQNDVLKITSEQTRDSDVYPRVYNVADLVIPIPNFIPSYNIGLPGAIRAAHENIGYGGNPGPVGTAPLTLAENESNAPVNASVLAQMGASGMTSGGTRAPMPTGYGPGGMGGAAAADFDTLIELITSTIAPQTWDEVGGPGSVEGFPTNLSLVVSQTQEVHEQIADLLEQLRRLQDLQVTIEVRFITLSDNFFERIGIDFDFRIDDNTNLTGAPPDDDGHSLSFGLNPDGSPTIDLDFPFTQGGFASTVPTFGGFDAMTAANFGAAILSDIEVFFLLQASQGDSRTNVMQAPKVTLFNGQQAFVSDTSQRPFVTSVIPVVGDFAAAQQPVITVLSEGTSLSVQAVVSADRRFVRLTLVPFFSTIGNVEEFTFEGTTTSDSGTAAQDPTDDTSTVNNGAQTTRSGTTVQLPTFAFTTVTTTVSVPDGGTVLLGGIKRMSEGRDERGVPMLSKVPYINRLFKNVGIGRTTQSLMLMVTPRIIIQEEEEEKLGIEITP